MLVNSLGGGFSSQMATVLTSGRQMMQTAGYMVRQMCPEYADGGAMTSAQGRFQGFEKSECALYPTLAANSWKQRCSE